MMQLSVAQMYHLNELKEFKNTDNFNEYLK